MTGRRDNMDRSYYYYSKVSISNHNELVAVHRQKQWCAKGKSMLHQSSLGACNSQEAHLLPIKLRIHGITSNESLVQHNYHSHGRLSEKKRYYLLLRLLSKRQAADTDSSTPAGQCRVLRRKNEDYLVRHQGHYLSTAFSYSILGWSAPLHDTPY